MRDPYQPDADPSVVLHAVSTDPNRIRNQTSGARRIVIGSGVVVVISAVLAIAGVNAAWWIVAAIFAVILLVGVFRWVVGAAALNASEERLLLLAVRTDGLRTVGGMLLSWDEIAAVQYQWVAAGGGTVVGLGGMIAKPLMDKALAGKDMDNARRVIKVILADYPATKARASSEERLRLMGPALGDPGYVSIDLSGSIGDDQFQPLLDTLGRELSSRGKELARITN